MRAVMTSLFCAAMLAASVVGATSAAGAVHLKGIDASFSEHDDFLTAECGFDVTFAVSGTASYTLVYGKTGSVVREVDTEPGLTITVSGNGKSSTTGSDGIYISKYPNGATPGAPATITVTGHFYTFPGGVVNAGPDFLTGHVVGFNEYGVPETEFDDFLAGHGPRGDFVAGACAALR
jgi:hypothetical protein